MTNDMKRCTGCKQDYPEDFFVWKNKKKHIRNRRCKNCTRAATKAHYLKYKQDYNSRAERGRRDRRITTRKNIYEYLLQHPCVVCGEADPIVLHFDHRDSKLKRKCVGQLSGYGWEAIKAEIDKCDVLCSNCHMKKTAKDFNWFKYRVSQNQSPVQVPGV